MTNEKILYSGAEWAIFNPISPHNNPLGFIGAAYETGFHTLVMKPNSHGAEEIVDL